MLLQTLMERELRLAMHDKDLTSLPLYPENRECRHPTARRVIDIMQPLSRHRLVTDEGDALDLYTNAIPVQRQLMKLYGLTPATYGRQK